MASKMSGSTRTIWIMAIVAVVSLGAGILLSQLITSPADAAADAAPPPAGPITVPVEHRTLANDIVLRADVVYEDPASVTLETGDIGGPAVVTGQVPEVGDTIEAGQVMIEVASRPVILLTGELPVFRTLRAGVSGADVVQLREALAELGIDAGDVTRDTYDAALAAGVRELYNRIGYEAPSAGGQDEIDAARERVRSAEAGVTAAQRELDNASNGFTDADRQAATADRDARRMEADLAFRELHAALDACGIAAADEPGPPTNGPTDEPTDEPDPGPDCSDATITGLRVALRQAEGALAAAQGALDAMYAPVDTTFQRQALDAARRELTSAQEALADAQSNTLTPLPASEVVYLASTPRRVDNVSVSRGSMVAGSPVMSVSGATMQISGNLAAVDAELVTVGSAVVIAMPGGGTVDGTVEEIQEPESTSDTRRRVIIIPDELTEEQRMELQYSNVRVTIPVASTDGDVLAVPAAALTAGPGGNARVERLEADGTTTLINVTTGLAAGGFVEIVPEGDLEVGDRVVVGVTSTPTSDDGDDDSDSGDEETSPEESPEEEG